MPRLENLRKATEKIKKKHWQPAETKSQEKPRNTNRGLRSFESIEFRKWKRSQKRKEARQYHRECTKGAAAPLESEYLGQENRKVTGSYLQHNVETNEEPSNKPDLKTIWERKPHKIKYGRKTRFATYNIRGIKRIGKREKIEYWILKNKIDILALQETKCNITKKERSAATVSKCPAEEIACQPPKEAG